MWPLRRLGLISTWYDHRIVAEELAPSSKRAENLAFHVATFQAEIGRDYPVTGQTRKELAELQEQLQLPADAVALAEAPLIAQAEARHQASRLAPPAPAAAGPKAALPPAPLPTMAVSAPLVAGLAQPAAAPKPAPRPAPAPVVAAATRAASVPLSPAALPPSPAAATRWWVKLLKWAGWLLVAWFVILVLAEL